MVLPPTVRPFWSTLLAEKAAAPAHRAWDFAADPFAAKKEVEQRQEKRKQNEVKREEAEKSGEVRNGNGNGNGGGREWGNVPEVRMTQTQREVVEEIIRRVCPPLLSVDRG
jgi:ATP-dependent RNA helicase DHX57